MVTQLNGANGAAPVFPLDQETCWQAVVSRDARFDGAFVYGVTSTSVYCRPWCPSRQPRLERVRFFSTPLAAEEAGFRPCRRCRPHGAFEPGPLVNLVVAACSHLGSRYREFPSLKELSNHLAVTPVRLERTFRRVLGTTPRQYADALRIERLKVSLREKENVAGALYESGYGSSSRLYERAQEYLGMTPLTYKKGGLGVHLAYVLTDWSSRRLLVAATSKGICAICLGETDESLEASLRSEYPNMASCKRDEGLRVRVEAALGAVESRNGRLGLPAEISTIAFRRRLWEDLRRNYLMVHHASS